ncbi:MAG TPA: hypothetical protein VNB28_08165 [Methylomirabilota bacterium]|jgi:hypothetical protein|nr:hypothetical protein [Methylomirabilota bacterium]
MKGRRLKELSSENRRYGYLRLHAMLRREGLRAAAHRQVPTGGFQFIAALNAGKGQDGQGACLFVARTAGVTTLKCDPD